jgi:hypothetical protein
MAPIAPGIAKRTLLVHNNYWRQTIASLPKFFSLAPMVK